MERRDAKRLPMFLALLFAVVLVSSASAQQQPAQQPNSQQPFTIQVNTQLVLETVMVRDKDGKNIEGLIDKDFVITEDNVPQTISVFRFERLDDTPAVNAPAAPIVPTVPAAPPQQVPNQVASVRQGDARYENR